MKPQTILVLSLAGNLALAAVAYRFARTPQAGIAIASHQEKAVAGKSGNEFQTNSAQKIVVTNYTTDEFTWHDIEAQDYKDYIAKLRSVDCPEETIRDIIVADVNKLFRSKRDAINGDDEEYKYWKTENNWETKAGRERQKQFQALEKEKSALLVELLGVDPTKERNKELGYFDYREQRLSFLPEEKRSQAREVQEGFQELKQEIYRDAIYDADDWRKLRKIETDEMAKLATILTPEELEQYQLRNSHTADQLRSDLDGFEPTEDEFKEIFHLREARADELISSNDQDDKETQETRKKATEEINAQVKAQLGDARFAEYERAQDWSYKELERLTEKLELPKESAAAVYDMKKVAEDQVKEIRSDKSLTPEQRTQALQAVREATEKAVATSLGGEKNFNRYKLRGGWWISNLAPTPRKKSTVIVSP
jgi:hypothetical protein